MDRRWKKLFLSGVNAAITGDMLTMAGITVTMDKKLLEELSFRVGLHE